jgi:hypothetical protein
MSIGSAAPRLIAHRGRKTVEDETELRQFQSQSHLSVERTGVCGEFLFLRREMDCWCRHQGYQT